MDKFNELKMLLMKDRSYRRFNESERIDNETLKEIVELSRYCASGRNLQPLKYILISEQSVCDEIFPLLKWAGYLPEWEGPEPGERPSAYIVQLLDTDITSNPLCDEGLQIQAITLGAVACGYGACIIKSFNSARLREILKIDSNLQPSYVIAMGKPLEEVVIEELKDNSTDSIKYYRTPDRVHHVPKRSLKDLVIKQI